MHSRNVNSVFRREHLMLGLFALGLVPRLVLLGLWGDALEFWEYETLGQHIAAGNGYVISRFGHAVLAFGDGNLYSFLTGSIYALFGHQPSLVAFAQAVLVSLAAPVLYVIAERPFGATKAAVGAALAAVHPGLLVYTLKLHPLGLDVLLLSLMLLWTLRATWSRPTTLLAGLTLGLNMMTRPTYFLAGIVALGVRWFAQHIDRRAIVAAVGISLLVAMPWVLRNWALLGQPMLVSTSFEDVWKGNNPAATGSGYLAPGLDVFDSAPIDLRDRIWQADEVQVNTVFARETLKFIEHQPDKFAGLVARKFVYFWWLPQEAGVLYPASWLAMYQLYAVVIYAFALIGAVGIVRGGSSEERTLLLTIVSVAMTLAMIHALAYVEGRHRWGIEPLILLLTARGAFTAAVWTLGQWRGAQPRGFRRLIER